MAVKEDCFAYIKELRRCKALKYLYCKDGECKFYKTKKERCDGCREAGSVITCHECKAKGIY